MEVQNQFWIYSLFWILVPCWVDEAHCSQTSELLDPGHAPSPEHARRSCSPVPTSFSSFVFIFLIFIFPISALTASLQFLCIPGAQRRPWMECVLGKHLFNEWLIDVYLFSLHEADGLVAFTVWWRFQATSGFDNLCPESPLMSNIFLRAWDLTFSYLPHDMFHLCHFQSRLIFFFH